MLHEFASVGSDISTASDERDELMNTSDPNLIRHEVQKLHSPTLEAAIKGQLAEVEGLLEQITEKVESLGDLPFFVKEHFWIAGFHQMHGEHSKAKGIYEQLIKLAATKKLNDEESLRCLASAFQNLVKIKSSLPDSSIKELLDIISRGLEWLEQVGKLEWSASLRLERSLVFKDRGELENAQREMEEALQLATARPDAPGYPLEIYQLELAKLLCITAADSAGKEPQALRHTRRNAEAVTKMDQLQEQLRSESDRVVEAIVALGQVISTISNESTRLKSDRYEYVSRMQLRISLPGEVVGDHQHVVCFVALPFEDDKKTFAYKTILLPALRRALELEPYFWQVGRADDKYFAETIERNIFEWVTRADVYMAEISDVNPNVMMELGYMRWSREPKQPLIVLKRKDIHRHLADLAGMITIPYTPASGKDADKTIAKELKGEFGKKSELLTLNTNKAHYLSPLFLQDKAIAEDAAEKLAGIYLTMERFAVADIDNMLTQIPGLPDYIAKGLQEEVGKILKGSRKNTR